MSVALLMLAGLAILRFGPALVASVIGTGAALVMVRRSRAGAEALISTGRRRATWARPSRAERRLLAASLDGAMKMTTLTSLRPATARHASRLHELLGAPTHW